jgi:hypothetical protein
LKDKSYINLSNLKFELINGRECIILTTFKLQYKNSQLI